MELIETIEFREKEFYDHVWDHSSDKFQKSFDLRRPLTSQEVKSLLDLNRLIKKGESEDKVIEYIRSTLLKDESFLFVLLQLIGLTRSKPISDLSPIIKKEVGGPPGNIQKLHLNLVKWKYFGPYLYNKLRTVFAPLSLVTDDNFAPVLESLNQATWPGYIRQERAKKSGGYAEQALAILLLKCGIPFQPEKKAENGLTADLKYENESYDIIIPNNRKPRLCIMSMAHSANIGQYGASKAKDAEGAKKKLQNDPNKPKLGLLIDGIGFRSNTSGLRTLLKHGDEFFQFNTFWKACAIGASVIGKKIDLIIPDPDQHQLFIERYSDAINLYSTTGPIAPIGWVQAGEGLVRIK